MGAIREVNWTASVTKAVEMAIMKSKRSDTCVSWSSLGKSRNTSQKITTRSKRLECVWRKKNFSDATLPLVPSVSWCTFSDEFNINLLFYQAADNNCFVRPGIRYPHTGFLILSHAISITALTLGVVVSRNGFSVYLSAGYFGSGSWPCEGECKTKQNLR